MGRKVSLFYHNFHYFCFLHYYSCSLIRIFPFTRLCTNVPLPCIHNKFLHPVSCYLILLYSIYSIYAIDSDIVLFYPLVHLLFSSFFSAIRSTIHFPVQAFLLFCFLMNNIATNLLAGIGLCYF